MDTTSLYTIGSLAVGLVGGGTLAPYVFAAKYAPYLKLLPAIFDILNPLLRDKAKVWTRYQIDAAIQLAVASVADGQLSPKEVATVLELVVKRFDPRKVATKAGEPEVKPDVAPLVEDIKKQVEKIKV